MSAALLFARNLLPAHRRPSRIQARTCRLQRTVVLLALDIGFIQLALQSHHFGLGTLQAGLGVFQLALQCQRPAGAVGLAFQCRLIGFLRTQ